VNKNNNPTPRFFSFSREYFNSMVEVEPYEHHVDESRMKLYSKIIKVLDVFIKTHGVVVTQDHKTVRRLRIALKNAMWICSV
jgi:hypothetical protein